MSNEKGELFLDTWRQLESTAEHLVGSDNRGGNVVLRLCRDPRFAMYRDRLDYCREVRNLLSHQAKLKGEFAVTPSAAMQEMLEEVLHKLEDPPRVASAMTPVAKMLVATPETPVLPVMRRMRQQGISHVPLLRNGRVIGVFSVDTVFQAVVDGGCHAEPDTTLSAFAPYLPTDRHMDQNFKFVEKDLPLADAALLFDRSGNRNKLKVMLVTASGSTEEPLLGVLTPYDLLGRID